MSNNPIRSVCISGVGKSKLYRKPTVYPYKLAIEACLKAIADAGLTPDDIDGICCWPAAQSGVGHGSSSLSPIDLKNALGLKINWYSAGDGPAQYASIIGAVAAITAGLCKHVICYRAEGERWVPMHGQAYQDGSVPQVDGWVQWMFPYWAPSAASWIALHAEDHMRRYGITREQVAWIPLTQRKNAALNPDAIYQEPLTMDEYMNARMISTPICLYDCDVPIDGGAAIVVSSIDAARDLRHRTVRFEAIGAALHGHDSWLQRDDWPNMLMHDAAKEMWKHTDLKPKDVDCAHLYDGFTYLTVLWLEALGLTEVGETGRFIEGGTRIARDGELPLNTNGGQLSEGRLHAFGHLIEAVQQLRGNAGPRQVKDAEIAVTGSGGGIFGSSLLLVRD